MIDAVKKRGGALEYRYIDVNRNKKTAMLLETQVVPSFLMVKNGSLIEMVEGPMNRERIECFICNGLDTIV